jgi:hypothetical protein
VKKFVKIDFLGDSAENFIDNLMDFQLARRWHFISILITCQIEIRGVADGKVFKL